jgi:hypothetical protein
MVCRCRIMQLDCRTRRGSGSVWEIDRRRVEAAQRYLEQISTQWDKALE